MITETAFYKYLLRLSLGDRTVHLIRCYKSQPNELYEELADFFQTYMPFHLAQKIEEFERKKHDN